MNEVNLAGYLIGIGIHHKDGTETYKVLDKPIHNRIVKTGINQMLMYNGTPTGGAFYNSVHDDWYPQNTRPDNTWYPIFRGNLNNHYGCLHFCQYGTDNTPTKFFQTALNAPYGDYTATVKTGTPYTYTYADDWNKVSIVITHQHNPVTEEVTVREIGYFGRCTRDTITEYLMFSRIALDEPIILKEGEYLFNTYKLVCTIDKEEHDIENFGGIEGQHARYRYCPYFPGTKGYIETWEHSSYYNNLDKNYKRGCFGFPGVLANGNNYYPVTTHQQDWDSGYVHVPRYFMFPQVYIKFGSTNNSYGSTNAGNYSQVQRNTYEHISYGINSNTLFPAYNETRQTSYLPTDVTNTVRRNENASHTFIDYDTDKNYRDIKLTLPKYNPDLNFVNNESVEMHYIRARGYDYKLGYYTWNEDHTEQTWHAQPIIKKVNEQIDFIVRTTITTDDTEAWQNGTLVEGEE